MWFLNFGFGSGRNSGKANLSSLRRIRIRASADDFLAPPVRVASGGILTCSFSSLTSGPSLDSALLLLALLPRRKGRKVGPRLLSSILQVVKRAIRVDPPGGRPDPDW